MRTGNRWKSDSLHRSLAAKIREMARKYNPGSMKKYGVFINGGNLLLRIDNLIEKYGFYTTRYVEAHREKEAAEKAKSLVMRELEDMALNDLADPVLIEVEEMELLESFGNALVPGSGFSLYKEGSH